MKPFCPPQATPTDAIKFTWKRPIEDFSAAADDPDLPQEVDALYAGKLRIVAKGLSHLVGMAQLVWRVWRRKPDVVHFQWVILPFIDSLAMWLIRRWHQRNLVQHAEEVERLLVIARSDGGH
mgnify:CR=1 FL=1